MAQPTGGTPTLAIFPTEHTRRAGDTLAVVAQQFGSGTGDGTMSYGADAMTAIGDLPGATFTNSYGELFALAAPASGSQAITAGGTGSPRGVFIRTYDTTTGSVLNVSGASGDSGTASVTHAAPNANNLGQLWVYLKSDTVTVTGATNCTLVGSPVAGSTHTVALYTITGANPSLTLSADAAWLLFAYDVEGTATGGGFQSAWARHANGLYLPH